MCERVIIEKQMGLKAQIEQFDSERKKQNFISVLHCLRDSYVWIPGTVTMSDIDY